MKDCLLPKQLNYLKILFLILVLSTTSCDDLLKPKPIDILTDDIVLNSADDVQNVELGLYSAFRPILSSVVVAGDCTSDVLIHRGTFSNFRELGTKQITSSNGSAEALWANIYNTIYVANFILERLPVISGVSSSYRNQVLATAHFLRGYAYFIAVCTFGGVPIIENTAISNNLNVARSTKTQVLELIENDFNTASGKLPELTPNAGFASEYALQAALAKYHLYLENWNLAESHATTVIESGRFVLDSVYSNVVLKDFTSEAIFEIGYAPNINDDPGTLNNLFVARREIIPSNQTVLALSSDESGERFSSISFNSNNLSGADNGWSVAKYGTADADNNNVVVFRLAEMYLIRAEARAKQGNVTGVNSAQTDINMLRARADEWDNETKTKTFTPRVGSVNQAQMIQIIENERLYELAFEGHRWFDLVRTGRASSVMEAFNTNWRDAYELWPIPQREIQTNPALVGHQNPGY